MKHISAVISISLFILVFIFGNLSAHGQGFHHAPPPPPHHPPQQTPQRPPTPPPTRVIPPPRPETMRPPPAKDSGEIPTNIEILTEWKDEVVGRIKDIGNWLLGFEGDDDVLTIEEDDNTFNIKDSRTEVMDADSVLTEKVVAENAYWAEVKATWGDVDPESMFYDSISEFLSTLNDDGSPKIPNVKLADISKDPIPTTVQGQDPQPEVAAPGTETPTTPEVKPADSPPEPTPIPVADPGQQSEEMITFGNPPEVQPKETKVEQPIPTLMELTKIEREQNLEKILSNDRPPTEFLSINGYQPPEPVRQRETAAEYKERVKRPPTDAELIDFTTNTTLEDFEEKINVLHKIDVPRNRINLNNEEFGGTVIVDQVDPATQELMLDLLSESTTDATIVYIGVQFPLVGVAISGGQGFEAGYNNAIENGAGPYEAIGNGIVGGGINAGMAAAGNKFGNLAKLKVTNTDTHSFIDVGCAIVTGFLGGTATEAMTGYGESSREYDYGYGTSGGGMNMEREYRDH